MVAYLKGLCESGDCCEDCDCAESCECNGVCTNRIPSVTPRSSMTETLVERWTYFDALTGNKFTETDENGDEIEVNEKGEKVVLRTEIWTHSKEYEIKQEASCVSSDGTYYLNPPNPQEYLFYIGFKSEQSIEVSTSWSNLNNPNGDIESLNSDSQEVNEFSSNSYGSSAEITWETSNSGLIVDSYEILVGRYVLGTVGDTDCGWDNTLTLQCREELNYLIPYETENSIRKYELVSFYWT